MRIVHHRSAHRSRRATFMLAGVLVLALLVLLPPVSARGAQTAAVHAHLLWSGYDRADVAFQLDRARSAGAGMVRVDLGWQSLEQEGKGRYNDWYLSKIDDVVAQAEARRIKVLFTVWATPCWASTAPDTLKRGCEGAWWERDVGLYPPANPSDYADALSFLVRRYRDRVAAWEIWNEPNLDWFFKPRDPVSRYAELVKAAYPAAKRAHPGATILAGSLSGADFEFTEALYAEGVKGHFDAWSVHPYSDNRSPLHPGIEGWLEKSFISGVPAVREVMLRRGDRKPLWLTEFGWSTCSTRNSGAWDNCFDPPVQAEYLRLAFKQMREWDYVPVGVWYNLQDRSPSPAKWVENFGLLRYDGTAKPAYAAFRSAARALHNTRGPAKRPPVLRVIRRRGRVMITGRFPYGRRARVRAYRWKRGAKRFSRRASYRAVIPVAESGRFRHRARKRALRRGRWLFVVRGGRAGVSATRARLR